MSTIYIDRDGDEWKKNCSGCVHRDRSKNGSGRTYCEALGEYLSDNRIFSEYYNQFPNSCPNFLPKNNY